MRTLTRCTAALLLALVGGLTFWSVVPVAFGWRADVVLSGSMAPRIHAGDVVVSAPVRAKELRPGEVVVFDDGTGRDRTILHRVVALNDDWSLITRGDANAGDDPGTVAPESVRGRPVLRVPVIGSPVVWLQEGDHLRLAATLLAFIAVSSPLLVPERRRSGNDEGLRPAESTLVTADAPEPVPAVTAAEAGGRPPLDQEELWCAHGRPRGRVRGRGIGRARPPDATAARAGALRTGGAAAASALVVPLVLPVLLGTAGASFTDRAANGENRFTTVASFPDYPGAVAATGPTFHHRLDDPPDAALTPEMGDASDHERHGTFHGRSDGPLVHYRYDEDSGTEVADASGNLHPATLYPAPGTDATWASSDCGGAVTLPAGAYASAPLAALRADQAFTVATWVQLSTTNSDRSFVSQDGEHITALALHYHRSGGQSRQFMFAMPREDAPAAALDVVSWSGSIVAGAWYHLAGVYRPGTGIQLFVDGAAAGGPVARQGTPWNAAGDLQLGRALYQSAYQFDGAGTLADTRVYQRALGVDEIGDLARSARSADAVTAADCAIRNDVPAFTAGRPGALAGSSAGTAVAFGGRSHASSGAVAASGTTSLELWLRTTSRRGGELLGSYSTASGPAAQDDHKLYLLGDGRLRFAVRDAAAPGGYRVATTSGAVQVTDGAWHHLVATVGPTRGTRLYVDGGLVASAPAPAQPITTVGTHWRVGGGDLAGWPDAPPDHHVTGLLDEVAVYDRELAPAVVVAHHHARQR